MTTGVSRRAGRAGSGTNRTIVVDARALYAYHFWRWWAPGAPEDFAQMLASWRGMQR